MVEKEQDNKAKTICGRQMVFFLLIRAPLVELLAKGRLMVNGHYFFGSI